MYKSEQFSSVILIMDVRIIYYQHVGGWHRDVSESEKFLIDN